jgi:Ca-activated chloride channel homolog
MNIIFAALLNGASLSALVTLAVWVGLRLTPRCALNAATRYGVWWATLAATVFLPLLYLPPDLWHRTLRAERRASAALGLAPPVSVALSDTPRHPAAGDGLAARGPLVHAVRWFPVKIAPGVWTRGVLIAWALSATLMLIRLLASCVLLWRRKMRAIDAPPHWAARVEDWTALCRCSRLSVRLAVSSEITTPMVAGLGRPTILIPARLMAELDVDEIGQIGLHEIAHLARGDDYALIVQRIVEAVFALHPAVRWIGRTLDLEREIACDDFVLNATGQARPYAACLVKVVELTGGVRGSLTAAAVAEGNSHLSRRVDMLLDGARHTGTRVLRFRLAAVAAAIAALIALMAQAPVLLAFAPPPALAAVQSPRVPDPPAEASPRVPAPPAPQPARVDGPPSPAVQTEIPSVQIAVTVQDPQNRYVTGLGPENFRVTEDGTPQKIASVSSQTVPMSIGILLDVSGSMQAKLPEAQRAIAEFLDMAAPASQIFLITYNQSAVITEGFTTDVRELKNRIDLVQPRGGTALREAILLALQQMQNAPNPARALLIVSDGGPDNSSSPSANDVKDAVSAANVPIFAISFPTLITRDVSRGIEYLNQIAELTGAQHFVPRDGGPLPAAAAAIALHNLYTIEYHSTNAARDGKYRKLRVEVLPPAGTPQLTVTYPPGYYATAAGH